MSEPILRGYGREASSDASAPITPDTVFLIASLSKVFAGMAVMLLVEEGFIDSLDDDICNVLPADWADSACRNPFFPNVVVTWRMLLTHRSSLTRDVPWLDGEEGMNNAVGYGPIDGYFGEGAGGECPLDDIFGFYRDFLIDKPTETLVGSSQNVNWYELGEENGGAWEQFVPGSEALYSNVATGYIALLVELATGISFPEFTKTRIFDPLQMDHTAWFRADLPPGLPEAMPVSFENGIFEDVGHYCFIDYSSGSMRSSMRDMARFLEAWLSYADTLWPREVGVDSISCQVRSTSINSMTNCDTGALWFLLNNDLKTLAVPEEEPFLDYSWTNGGWHDGGEAGVRTHMVLLPEAGVYAAVMTNTDGNIREADEALLIEMVNTIRSSFSSPPTLPPEPTPPPSPRDYLMIIQVFHDESPDETSWVVQDANGFVWARQDVNEVQDEFAFIQVEVRVPAGEYTFVIRDEFGDGICCGEGTGFFGVSVCNRLIMQGGSFFYHDLDTFVIDDTIVPC